MPHNSRKRVPILIILSSVAFSDELQKTTEKYLPPHLKSVAALPCKFECSTLPFYNTLFNANVTQNRLFTVPLYQIC